MAETLPGPLAEYLGDRVPKAAARAHRRYPAVPAEDFQSAMWERVYRRRDHFCQLWERGSHGVIWSELCRAGTKTGREDDRYRRATRALQAGYSVYDIEFYSTGVLGRILPALVEAEFDVSVAMERAMGGTDAAGVHISSSDPFGGSENYLVVLTDVAGAFERLPEGMKRLLAMYYGATQDDTEQGRWERDGLASSMGLTADALGMRVNRALKRLQDELGGSDPWQ